MKKSTFLAALLLAAVSKGELVAYVDPFVGTDTVGHTHPAACVPFGMVQAGPDTGTMAWKYCSGYQWGDTNVLGFSQTHLNGTGCPDLGDVQVLPFSGLVRAMPMQSGFRKENEKARPGFYSTYLDADGICVEIAAEKRGALYRFRYDKGAAKLLFNLPFAVAEKWTHPETSDAWMEPRGPCRLVGSLTRKGWIPGRRVAFAVAFDRNWTSLRRLDETVRGVPRFAVDFADVKPGETVQMKIALSTRDVAAAERNLKAMAPGFDFARVRETANEAWNRVLSRITCEGTEAEKKNFYTAAYHLFQQPNDYADADEPMKLTTLSLWDTFRAAQPLYTIVAPEIAQGTVDSCLAHGRANGELPVMSYGGKALYCMVGNHSVPVIVDWFLKEQVKVEGEGEQQRARSDFWETAYRLIKDTLTKTHPGKIKEEWELYDRYGYYPCDLVYGESVSRTLECGYDDWCAAQMAYALGHDEDRTFFLKRSERWRNVFDSKMKLMRGKDSLGRWRTPFDPYAMGHGADTENDFTEGNAYQYTWHVLQDPMELIAAFGSSSAFVERLDAIFKDEAKVEGDGLTVDISGMIGQYVHGNEPSHHVPYFYTLAGRPDRAAEVVREVFDKFYYPKPDGLCGNDDCGQMSAWYLFSAMGFYPFNPCGGEYVLGAPQVPKVVLKVKGLGEGEQWNKFVVVAKGLSQENKYVKSVTLNGKPVADGKIRHADIMKGGVLEFTMWSNDLGRPRSGELLSGAESNRVVSLSAGGASTLTFYPPAHPKAPSAAVVICPGGGYRELCDTYEGVDMAKWLAARGVAAFVLRYRLPPKGRKDAMLEDVGNALECVRARAGEWNVDAHKVGVLGFSAGGHLACMAGTLSWTCRADFMALVYPHVSMSRGLGGEHMREAFFGPGYLDSEIDKFSGEKLVTQDTPRTFLVHARTDEICSVEHSRRFVAAMRDKGRPIEYVELESGRHGLGCGKGKHWAAWLAAFDKWLSKEGLR